ncbi:Signal recognition particle subunit SRP72 [Coemansia sp. IMI 209128]|nr:Srp72p [Coemansia sp. RSA 2530]KAJ2698791.1 Signal recognition particle subunit SRP72 [Coemansia sp. IMI 209128]
MPKQSLETHFSAIRDALASGNLLAVFEAAHAGLSDHPKEVEFAKIQIVALLKQDKVRQALNLIEWAYKSKLFSPKDMAYEAAYCNFLAGNYELAKKQLKHASPGPLVGKLSAQIAYKSGQFSECVEIYASLISEAESDSPERSDLVLNMSAAKAAAALQHGQDSSIVGATTDTLSESYELMFNSATRLLGSGRPQEAVTLLAEAERLARATLANDKWSDKDIRGEVGPIEAQRAVALHQLGRIGEARTIYASLLSEQVLDTVTCDVVAHNYAALGVTGVSEAGASATIAKRALLIPGRSTSSLSRHQKALMVYNMAVMQATQKQFVAARRSLRALGKMDSSETIANAGVVSAAVSLRMGRGRQALNELAAISFAREPVSSVRTALAAAQVSIQLGDNKRAADILEAWKGKAQSVDLDSLKLPAEFAHHYFGICLLHNWLLSKHGKSETEGAAEAAEHLYSKTAAMQQPNVDLLVAVGSCLSYAGLSELACECFGRARAVAPEQDVNSNAALPTSALASLAPEGDSKLIAHLLQGYRQHPKLARAIPGIPPRTARRLQPVGNVVRKGAVANLPRAKHSRSTLPNKRRNRKLTVSPPKSYEVGRTPDPERWIPLRQRSYYKSRGRGNRQTKLRGGAQGGAVDTSSGLGGTGSARIAGKAASPALMQTLADDGVLAASVPVSSSHGAKGKPKGAKGGKGKKGSW